MEIPIACSQGMRCMMYGIILFGNLRFPRFTKTIVWWRLQKSPLWETFGKDAFSVTVLTGYVWMVGQTGGKKIPFFKSKRLLVDGA